MNLLPNQEIRSLEQTDNEVQQQLLIVQDLLSTGVSLVSIIIDNDNDSNIPKSTFQVAAKAFNKLSTCPDPNLECTRIINENNDNSAHVTGYHNVGGSMSERYNQYREGFIFSDGNTNINIVNIQDFQIHCIRLQNLLHNISNKILNAIATYLQLPTNNYFYNKFGPFNTNSQWHLKRYVKQVFIENTKTDNNNDNNTIQQQQQQQQHDHNNNNVEWLPSHTDPSIISVIIHDRPGISIGGAGLQFLKDKVWYDIPYSGHAVAIILVGSILQHITGNYFSACRHRVIYNTDVEMCSSNDRRRMAATLFTRPAPDAILELLPSKLLIHQKQKKSRRITFGQWNEKTARNYEKAKRKQSNTNTPGERG